MSMLAAPPDIQATAPVAIPFAVAALCLDCDAVFAADRRRAPTSTGEIRCPACAGRSWISLALLLDRYAEDTVRACTSLDG
jgi:hypothetical protein